MKYGLCALLLLALVPGCNRGKKEESPKAAPSRQTQMPRKASTKDQEMMPEMEEMEMMDVEEMPEVQK